MSARLPSERLAPRASVTHLLKIDNRPAVEMQTICGKPVAGMGPGHYFVGNVGADTVSCLLCKGKARVS